MKINTTDSLKKIKNQYQKLNPLAESQNRELPNNKNIISVINHCRALFFPEFFSNKILLTKGTEEFAKYHLQQISTMLTKEVKIALKNFSPEGNATNKAEYICQNFIDKLPEIHTMLYEDKEAFFDGDPAAENDAQIILSYPGFFAVMVYRLAHLLHNYNVPMIPRMMSEYAHSLTGVDIHPGAKIGKSFFIDHGTGVVIGETTIIGNNVRIYQSVTLGGLTIIDRAHSLHVKRHPTIGNNVTIYANATILGGESVIGDNCIIGGGTFITNSIPENTIVSIDLKKDNFKTRLRSKK